MAKKPVDQSLVSEVPPVEEAAPAPKAEPAPSAIGGVMGRTLTRNIPDPAPVVSAPGQFDGMIDVRREGFQISDGIFHLNRFVEGADYADFLNQRRIWSIGRNVHDGRIEAALDTRYYGDPNWECLFLR